MPPRADDAGIEEKATEQDQALLYAKDLADARAAARGLLRRMAPGRAEVRKLLIADDDASTRLLVSTTLSGEGYEIIEAKNGDEALAAARTNRPTLALLDVDMPGLTGLDVCRLIRSSEELNGTKIVLLTGRSLASDHKIGLEAGADVYLTKPFRPKQLLDVIETLMGPPTASHW